jgi:cation transport protein ChaC
MANQTDVWVFGYASLMWNPDFDHIDAKPAHLFGYHRALCVYSYLYRGTHKEPGIVAGLLPGGSCKGVAFRVAGKNWDRVHHELNLREMVYEVYTPKSMQADIEGHRQGVFGYIANPDSGQYAGSLNVKEITKLIKKGIGTNGTCIEYLENTVQHMTELGINNRKLKCIIEAAKSLT